VNELAACYFHYWRISKISNNWAQPFALPYGLFSRLLKIVAGNFHGSEKLNVPIKQSLTFYSYVSD
jgi:hypothetical protein